MTAAKRVVTLLSASGPGDVPERADVHGVLHETKPECGGGEVWTLVAAGVRCAVSGALVVRAPRRQVLPRLSLTSQEQQQYLGLTRSVRLAARCVLSRS